MIKYGKDKNEFQMSQKIKKHSIILKMFMPVTIKSSVFMGKNYLNNYQSIVNTTEPTLRQIFDISSTLVLSKMRSLNWKQLVGKIIHGNTCH